MLFSVPNPNCHFSGFVVTEQHLQKFNEGADKARAISETMSLWEKIKDFFSDDVYKKALSCLYDLVQAKNIANNPETRVDDRATQITLVNERLDTLKGLASNHEDLIKLNRDEATGFMTFHVGKAQSEDTSEPPSAFPVEEFNCPRAKTCWESIDSYFNETNKTQAKTILNSLFHPKYTYKERIAKFAELARLVNEGEQHRFQIGLRSIPPRMNVSFSIVGADIMIDGQSQLNVTAIPGAACDGPGKVREALLGSKINCSQLKNCSTNALREKVEAFIDLVMVDIPKNWGVYKSYFCSENQKDAKKFFDDLMACAGKPDLVIFYFSKLAQLAKQDKRDLFKISVSGSKSELDAGKIKINLKLNGATVLIGICDICEVAENLLGVAGLPRDGSDEADKLNARHALKEISAPEKALLGKMLITLYKFGGQLPKTTDAIAERLTMMKYLMARDHVRTLYEIYRKGERIGQEPKKVRKGAPNLAPKRGGGIPLELEILKPLNFGNRGYTSKFGWVGYVVTPATVDTEKTVRFLMVHPLIQAALNVPLPVGQGEDSEDGEDNPPFIGKTCHSATLSYLSSATNYMKFLYKGDLEDGKPRKPNEEIQSVLKEIYDMHGGTLLIGERNALCSDPMEFLSTSPRYRRLEQTVPAAAQEETQEGTRELPEFF